MRVVVAAALCCVGRSTTPNFVFLLGDDIGWGDVGYNGGTALTPHLDEWTKVDGTVTFMDGHSGGTVCSPTRATILTGRNHFRDCVSYVYDCSDMTECDPHFPFAQQRTCDPAADDPKGAFSLNRFTVADAVRAKGAGYTSFFGGKWHLGSLYNDTAFPSSPLFHGFDSMDATVEVAPTATANCQCDVLWNEACNFGHYGNVAKHCAGGPNPGGGSLPDGCCFNYWHRGGSPHGVCNLTAPSEKDDSQHVAKSFHTFLDSTEGPYLAHLSFHNCHIPFIGQDSSRALCKSGETCRLPKKNSTEAQFDFYACLNELDASVGAVLKQVRDRGDYGHTMIWFASDNGPEGNCNPTGFCDDDFFKQWPGDAGKLRGRKRDVWEGGHRVPTVVSWPNVVKGPARVSWQTVATMDFFATVMDALQVRRPEDQEDWPVDGLSIVPILASDNFAWKRQMAWAYRTWPLDARFGYAWRHGDLKVVVGSYSCGSKSETCAPALYDLSLDLNETRDLAAEMPDVLADMLRNLSLWSASVSHSRQAESLCEESVSAQNPSNLPDVHIGNPWARFDA